MRQNLYRLQGLAPDNNVELTATPGCFKRASRQEAARRERKWKGIGVEKMGGKKEE